MIAKIYPDGHPDLQGKKDPTHPVRYFDIRKLTPRECLRLMGVNEKRIQQAKQSGISKTQVYKMAGNSIVVHQLHAIFEQMFYPIPQRGEQLKLFENV